MKDPDVYVPDQLWELRQRWEERYRDKKWRGKKKGLLQYILRRELIKKEG